MSQQVTLECKTTVQCKIDPTDVAKENVPKPKEEDCSVPKPVPLTRQTCAVSDSGTSPDDKKGEESPTSPDYGTSPDFGTSPVLEESPKDVGTNPDSPLKRTEFPEEVSPLGNSAKKLKLDSPGSGKSGSSLGLGSPMSWNNETQCPRSPMRVIMELSPASTVSNQSKTSSSSSD